VTDLLPAKAGVEVAAADIPRADLVGVSTQGDGPAVVAGVAIALPHNKAEPGVPAPAGTAATQAVETKRSKYGKNHNRTRGCNAAATSQFGSHVHPESIRLAKAIGAVAARRQALQANVNEAAGPDPVSGVHTSVASTVASQTLARVPVALGHCDETPARELGQQRRACCCDSALQDGASSRWCTRPCRRMEGVRCDGRWFERRGACRSV
jgi:hypothetical protein